MIHAKFTSTLTNVTTKAVTQWDYGRTLRIEGLDLPTAVRIDFGVDGGSETTGRIGITADRVTDVVIPDSLLEQANKIVAYVYVNDTQEGKTVRTIFIPVNARPMPEEYDAPESKALFAEAIETVNNAADGAKTAEISAKSHADSANASREATRQIADAFAVAAETAVKDVNDAGATQVQAIATSGENAVSVLNTTCETHRKAVEQAGTGAVADVETEKQEAISLVKAEGETQLRAIAEETAQIVADREQIDKNTRNKAVSIVLDAEGKSIVVNDASDCYLHGLKVFGKTTQDGTPTPDSPVDIINMCDVEVVISGKNLCHINDIITTNNNYDNTFMGWIEVEPNTTYTLSRASIDGLVHLLEYKDNSRTSFASHNEIFSEKDGVEIKLYGGLLKKTFTTGTNIKYLALSISSDTKTTFTVEHKHIMLEKAIDVTEYEPYRTIRKCSIPRTLHGIPVASGGNYTDENGQQWICDEVDFARGVYVQRCKIIDGYDGEDIPGVYMSNTGELSTGVTVLFALAAPIETPLTDAEINAFRALHSNKPVTTILNDAGAYMAVEYVADTKTYIDRKIAEMLKGGE